MTRALVALWISISGEHLIPDSLRHVDIVGLPWVDGVGIR